MKKTVITTTSEQQTESLGRSLAKQRRGGGVIALEGNLGAGKTVLVRGIARGLGFTGLIQSPTFVLMKVYPIDNRAIHTLVHVDCYRIDHSNDLLAIGLHDYILDPTALVVIEWADKVRELLTPQTMTISFRSLKDKTRRITLQQF